MEKIKVTQDTLYNYLTEHNFTLSVLSARMGVSNGILMGCLRHDLNRLGQPMKLSAVNVARLNAALEQVAAELRGCMLTFDNEHVRERNGKKYDPALAESIKQGMSKYFKMKGLTARVLGWTAAQCNTKIIVRSTMVYGNVTRDDADRLNAELISVAGVLSSYEVVNIND